MLNAKGAHNDGALLLAVLLSRLPPELALNQAGIPFREVRQGLSRFFPRFQRNPTPVYLPITLFGNAQARIGDLRAVVLISGRRFISQRSGKKHVIQA
jgi:hypothetical protein